MNLINLIIHEADTVIYTSLGWLPNSLSVSTSGTQRLRQQELITFSLIIIIKNIRVRLKANFLSSFSTSYGSTVAEGVSVKKGGGNMRVLLYILIILCSCFKGRRQ